MKAVDLLLLPVSDLPNVQTIILTGDDQVLKRILTKHISDALLKDDREDLETNKVEKLLTTMKEGSVLGSRLVVIDFEGKWCRLPNFLSTLTYIAHSDDAFIIRSSDIPTGLTPNNACKMVDCTFSSHKKTREKLAKVLATYYKINIFDDALKKVVERTDDTAQLESSLLTLELACSINLHITVADVGKLLKERSAKRDIPRSLIRRNIPKLVKDMEETDSPPYFLTILHNTLLRIHGWLEMTLGGMKEDEVFDLLKVPARAKRDWRLLRKYYSSRIVREVLEATADAFDSFIRGRPWQERLRFALKKLS